MHNKEQKRIPVNSIMAAVLILAYQTSVAASTSSILEGSTKTKSNMQATQAKALQSGQTNIPQKQKMAEQVEQETPDKSTDQKNPTKETTDDLEDENTPIVTKDPLEQLNRAMFQFNTLLDEYITKPIATSYNIVMPKPLNEGVHNFFNNMGELPTIANDILQLNVYQTLNDAWRLVINTTVGVLGFFDIASRMGLPYYANDFGLTLATWGYKDSTFIVIPFWGPRTVRDGIGLPVDYYAFSVYPYIDPPSARYSVYAVSVIDARAQLLKFQPVLDEAAIDKYVFIRNAYMQRRTFQIKEAEKWGPKQSEETPIATTD